VAGAGSEHGAVVGEQRRGQAVQGGGLVEAVHDVLGFRGGVGVRDEEQAGVIIDEVEDLCVLAGCELPVRDVCLPRLVW
jgi:hypothetical protein